MLTGTLIGPEQAYRAIAARDSRFDGYFILAVRTTGIYCRPSCPAATPKPGNAEFYPTAAAAQSAGYRACRRCLPDAVPGSPEWDLRTDLAGRAMRLINDGVVERDGVHGLAARLGYSSRHLTRELRTTLGAGPLALARAHRAHAARTLVETTTWAFADIAFAAGFSSIRQFNDTVREVFGCSPTRLRGRARGATPGGRAPGASVTLRLPLRPPADLAGLLRFLADRAVGGVEEAGDGEYGRSLRLPHGTGTVRVRAQEEHVQCTLRLSDPRDLVAAVSRVRRLLDLDADPEAVRTVLGADPALEEQVSSAPGMRVPGSVDGAEIVLRAVLGQQVSVASARTLAERVTAELGDRLETPDGSITTLFPTPEAVAQAPDGVLRGPRQRITALRRVAALLAEGALRIDPGRTPEDLRRALLAVPGIGPWTADYVVLRALGAPDVLLDGDLALRRGAERLGLPSSPKGLRYRSNGWSPWRSYAGMYLWRAGATPQ